MVSSSSAKAQVASLVASDLSMAEEITVETNMLALSMIKLGHRDDIVAFQTSRR